MGIVKNMGRAWIGQWGCLPTSDEEIEESQGALSDLQPSLERCQNSQEDEEWDNEEMPFKKKKTARKPYIRIS